MKALFLVVFLFLAGCATTIEDQSEVVIKQSLPTTQSISDIKKKLASEGYFVDREDKSIGLIQLQPVDQMVKRGVLDVTWPVKTQHTLLQTKSGVQITTKFQCQYGSILNGTGNWAGCYRGDKEIQPQLEELAKAFAVMLQGSVE